MDPAVPNERTLLATLPDFLQDDSSTAMSTTRTSSWCNAVFRAASGGFVRTLQELLDRPPTSSPSDDQHGAVDTDPATMRDDQGYTLLMRLADVATTTTTTTPQQHRPPRQVVQYEDEDGNLVEMQPQTDDDTTAPATTGEKHSEYVVEPNLLAEMMELLIQRGADLHASLPSSPHTHALSLSITRGNWLASWLLLQYSDLDRLTLDAVLVVRLAVVRHEYVESVVRGLEARGQYGVLLHAIEQCCSAAIDPQQQPPVEQNAIIGGAEGGLAAARVIVEALVRLRSWLVPLLLSSKDHGTSVAEHMRELLSPAASSSPASSSSSNSLPVPRAARLLLSLCLLPARDTLSLIDTCLRASHTVLLTCTLLLAIHRSLPPPVEMLVPFLQLAVVGQDLIMEAVRARSWTVAKWLVARVGRVSDEVFLMAATPCPGDTTEWASLLETMLQHGANIHATTTSSSSSSPSHNALTLVLSADPTTTHVPSSVVELLLRHGVDAAWTVDERGSGKKTTAFGLAVSRHPQHCLLLIAYGLSLSEWDRQRAPDWIRSLISHASPSSSPSSRRHQHHHPSARGDARFLSSIFSVLKWLVTKLPQLTIPTLPSSSYAALLLLPPSSTLSSASSSSSSLPAAAVQPLSYWWCRTLALVQHPDTAAALSLWSSLATANWALLTNNNSRFDDDDQLNTTITSSRSSGGTEASPLVDVVDTVLAMLAGNGSTSSSSSPRNSKKNTTAVDIRFETDSTSSSCASSSSSTTTNRAPTTTASSSSSSCTALQAAIRHQYPTNVSLLLSRGAAVDGPRAVAAAATNSTEDGLTPLMLAIHTATQLLLSASSSSSSCPLSPPSSSSAAMTTSASLASCVSIVRLLLQHEASVHAVDAQSRTLLHYIQHLLQAALPLSSPPPPPPSHRSPSKTLLVRSPSTSSASLLSMSISPPSTAVSATRSLSTTTTTTTTATTASNPSLSPTSSTTSTPLSPPSASSLPLRRQRSTSPSPSPSSASTPSPSPSPASLRKLVRSPSSPSPSSSSSAVGNGHGVSLLDEALQIVYALLDADSGLDLATPVGPLHALSTTTASSAQTLLQVIPRELWDRVLPYNERKRAQRAEQRQLLLETMGRAWQAMASTGLAAETEIQRTIVLFAL